MAEVKWIKIVTDIFDDEKMLLIDALPERDAIIVIWLKLLCLAGKQNNGGVFMISDKIAYTDEMLATIFRRPLNTVRLALQTFEQFGMIEIINNTITIPNWEKHQSLDKLSQAKEKNRARVEAYRERQKQLVKCNAYSNVTVTQCNATDKEGDIEGDKEGEYISPAAPPKTVRHKYGSEKNVLLTDDEYRKLSERFPEDYEERIENMSVGIAIHGYKYKSHYLAILKWAERDADKSAGKERSANPFLDILKGAGT